MKTGLRVSLLFLLCSLPASAGTLYENGPINGETDAWTINLGFVMSDSITISTPNSTITGLSFAAWLFQGDTLESVQVLITSEDLGGTIYFNGVVNFNPSGCFLNNYGYDVCTETGGLQWAHSAPRHLLAEYGERGQRLRRSGVLGREQRHWLSFSRVPLAGGTASGVGSFGGIHHPR